MTCLEEMSLPAVLPEVGGETDRARVRRRPGGFEISDVFSPKARAIQRTADPLLARPRLAFTPNWV